MSYQPIVQEKVQQAFEQTLETVQQQIKNLEEEHHRQLAQFIGIVPSSHRSGGSVRFTGRITKQGDSDLRANLYMAARSAKRFNLACKELYNRLRANGKPHKQAMVAVMNKLIRQVFAVIKNDFSFNNEYYLKFKNN